MPDDAVGADDEPDESPTATEPPVVTDVGVVAVRDRPAGSEPSDGASDGTLDGPLDGPRPLLSAQLPLLIMGQKLYSALLRV